MSTKNDTLSIKRAFNRGVRRLTRSHHKICEKRLGSLAIHRSQHMLLMHLSRLKEPPSQKELAEHLEVSPAAVAVSLKKLEAEGYIARSATEDDSRINEITITPKGREIIEESRRILDGIDAEIFAGIGHDELLRCIETLGRIEANIKVLLEH